jgi:hypothetical protein
VATFWIWWVRNPGFFVAAAGLAVGVSGIVTWSLAMPVAVAGVVVGDAGLHLARSSRLRAARRAARAAARANNMEVMRRFNEYQRVERDAA